MNKAQLKRRVGTLARSTFGASRLQRAGRVLGDLGSNLPDNDMRFNGELDLQYFAISHGLADVVIDVGANLGLWTEELIRTSADLGRLPETVLLIEADPGTCERLRTRVSSWNFANKILVEQLAVSDEGGEAMFHSYGAGVGINSLVESEQPPAIETNRTDHLVEVVTGADLAARHRLSRVGFVKVDTEGNDLKVLQGFLPLIETQKLDLVQFEYNHRWIANRAFLKDVFDLAALTGWSVGRLVEGGVLHLPRWRPELETYREANYAFSSPAVTELLDRSHRWEPRK